MLLVGLLAADAPRRSRVERVPDEQYEPKVGDQVTLAQYNYRRDELLPAPACASAEDYRASWKATDGDPTFGKAEKASGRLFLVDPWTEAVVLELEGRRPSIPARAAVRVLDGPYQGRTIQVPRFCAARLVSNPEYAPGTVRQPPASKPRGKWTIAEVRAIRAAAERQIADSDLNVARNLEKSGKPAQAIKYYEKIVRDFPASAEAEVARRRLGVLRPDTRNSPRD